MQKELADRSVFITNDLPNVTYYGCATVQRQFGCLDIPFAVTGLVQDVAPLQHLLSYQ